MMGVRPLMMGAPHAVKFSGTRTLHGAQAVRQFNDRKRPLAASYTAPPLAKPLVPIALEEPWGAQLGYLVEMTLESGWNALVSKPEHVPAEYAYDPEHVNENGTVGAWIPPERPAKRQATESATGAEPHNEAADMPADEATEDAAMMEARQDSVASEAEVKKETQSPSENLADVADDAELPIIPAPCEPKLLKPETNFMLRYVCEVERRAMLLQEEEDKKLTDGADAVKAEPAIAPQELSGTAGEAAGTESAATPKPSGTEGEASDGGGVATEGAQGEETRDIDDAELYFEKQLLRLSETALPSRATSEQRHAAALVLKLGQVFGLRVAIAGLADPAAATRSVPPSVAPAAACSTRAPVSSSAPSTSDAMKLKPSGEAKAAPAANEGKHDVIEPTSLSDPMHSNDDRPD